MIKNLERYEEIALEIKKLEDEKDTIGEEIKKAMIEQGADKTPKLKAGYISLAKRKSYKYSEAIAVLADTLKEKKKAEELNGTAEESETVYLIYKKSDK